MKKKLSDFRQKMRKDKKGFTLVELIVVLVILAILIALLIPTLTGYIDKANKKKVQSEARQVLMAAQTLAEEDYSYEGTDAKTICTGSAIPLTTKQAGASTDDPTIAELAEVTGKYLDSSRVTVSAAGKVTNVSYNTSKFKAVYDGTSWKISK